MSRGRVFLEQYSEDYPPTRNKYRLCDTQSQHCGHHSPDNWCCVALVATFPGRYNSNQTLISWILTVFFGVSRRGSPSAPSESKAPSSSSSPSSPCSLPSTASRCFLLLFFAALDFFLALSLATTAERLWSPLSRSSIFSARCSRASLRFCSRERVSWHLTTMPVGICRSWTAELVLFCFREDGQNLVGEGFGK